MADVLLSIRPHFADMILDGTKTVEVRKTTPRRPMPNGRMRRVWLYATGTGNIVGAARLCRDTETTIARPDDWDRYGRFTGLNHTEWTRYLDGQPAHLWLYAPEVNDLRHAPIPLTRLGIRAPQSWRYLDDGLSGYCLMHALDAGGSDG